MNIINKFFGTYSEREIKKINKQYICKINELENTYSSLSDRELQDKTFEFKNRLENNETLDDILIEAFAVCREASKRILNMRHFDVQLMGGIVLHQGRIAEMKTGEGKTLVATLPAYLNALTEKGVLIVTVNDYLANRDRELMKPLYDFLGVTSEVIISSTPKHERKELYKADIVYITNSELGFDYLKDNMVMSIEDKVQRGLNFAIVDEVDSILIDEARTPLIISSSSDKPTHLYNIADIFAQSLEKDDLLIDEKLKTVSLSETGIEKAETVFGLNNYADMEHNELRHHIKQSLQANYSMKKDIDYIVKNNQVIIIDEFTGRIADGRRYSNGLHQAIEAKEGVEIQKESETLATITYQNFFRMFNKLSGMTGTAETEQQEFNETYGLDVVIIPTNKPIARKDKEDKLYMSEKAKINGILKDIERNYKKGRPVLVGTPSIEKSEQLSLALNKLNIPHQVLNAKQHDMEAEIIAKAGQKGSITIATNMAGRGTDIKLGEGVLEVGGLKVIGTERADNRRIDNQLRGRSGRQGDPGVSQFYTSFDDKLIAFATEKYKQLLQGIDINDEKPVKNKLLSKVINTCQKAIENAHFETRKTTIKYDDVVNKQREIIYSQRDEVLNANDLEPIINTIIKSLFTKIIEEELVKIDYDREACLNALLSRLEPCYFDEGKISLETLQTLSVEEIKDYIIGLANGIVADKKKDLEESFLPICRNILLTTVDKEWQQQVDSLDILKRDIKLLAYKQVDPIQEYIMKSYDLFDSTMFDIQETVISSILKFQICKPKIEKHEKLTEFDGIDIITK